MAISLPTSLQFASPWLASMACLTSKSARVFFKWLWWLLKGSQLAESLQQVGYCCQKLIWQHFLEVTAKNDH